MRSESILAPSVADRAFPHRGWSLLTASVAAHFVIELSDLIVSSIEETGEGELLQKIAFDYAKIEYSYQRQNADGSLDTPVKAGWDLKANTKV